MDRLTLLRSIAWLAQRDRTGPIRDDWGRSRGTPVDRWYIERFLAAHSSDITGDVLEVMDDRYTRMFGTNVRSTRVLDVEAANSSASLIADLESPNAIPAAAFDCVLITQTLHYVLDVRTAVASIFRGLRPGGTCLATVPIISPLDAGARPAGEYWRLTQHACRRIFGEAFGPEQVEVGAPGNARAAVAFLLGLAAEELDERELTASHERFPLVATIRAAKR